MSETVDKDQKHILIAINQKIIRIKYIVGLVHYEILDGQLFFKSFAMLKIAKILNSDSSHNNFPQKVNNTIYF